MVFTRPQILFRLIFICVATISSGLLLNESLAVAQFISEPAKPSYKKSTSKPKSKPKPKTKTTTTTTTTKKPSSITVWTRNPIGISAVAGYHYVGLGMGVEAWSVWPHSGFNIGASFIKSSGEIESANTSKDGLKEQLAIELTSLTPTVRFYADPSFYLSVGYSLTSVSGKYGYKASAAGTHDTFVDFSAKANLLQVGFGHTWKLITGNIMIIDWIGYGHLLGSSISLGGDSTTAAGDTVEQRVQFYEGKSTSSHLQNHLKDQLRFYAMMVRIGFVF